MQPEELNILVEECKGIMLVVFPEVKDLLTDAFKDTQVYFDASLLTGRGLRRTLLGKCCSVGNRHHTITLNPTYTGKKRVKCTLLHELSHIIIYGHNPQFKSCLKRIARYLSLNYKDLR
jgi:hypothetical protein